MFITHFANALIWVGGVLNVLGLLGGVAFLVFWLFGFVRVQKDEHRCHKCREFTTCPAADTGVSYPCAYYYKRR